MAVSPWLLYTDTIISRFHGQFVVQLEIIQNGIK